MKIKLKDGSVRQVADDLGQRMVGMGQAVPVAAKEATRPRETTEAPCVDTAEECKPTVKRRKS